MASPLRRAAPAAAALAALLPLAGPAHAATVIAGGTNNGNAFPFGTSTGTGAIPYAGEYQQLYSAADFAGPVAISELDFASAIGGTPGPQVYNFTLGLSTTAASLASPSTSYAANKGADFTTVFSGPLTAALTDTSAFDLLIPLTTPFDYDPARGNLLLDVVINQPTTGGTTFFVNNDPNAFNPKPNSDVSRVFNSAGNGAPTAQPGGGLETRFTVGPQAAAVPESSSLALLGLGLVPVGLLARKRGFFKAR